VTGTLQSSLNALSGPEGTWLRHWLGRDPLEFRNQVFRKLGAVAVLPEARIEGGFLVDPTGRHVLLVAETPVPMSDSRAGEQMLRYVDQAISEVVPAGIRAHVVCAHRYTVANAATIKMDLVGVFAVSSIALIAVFLLLLRHWRALFVFAVPSLAVLAGVLATAAIFGGVSAITVGFGAVLLGLPMTTACTCSCLPQAIDQPKVLPGVPGRSLADRRGSSLVCQVRIPINGSWRVLDCRFPRHDSGFPVAAHADYQAVSPHGYRFRPSIGMNLDRAAWLV
jgi:hypothetical protein